MELFSGLFRDFFVFWGLTGLLIIAGVINNFRLILHDLQARDLEEEFKQ